MDEGERQQAVHQLGALLRLVHTSPGPQGLDGPVTPPFLQGDTLECPHQLPPARLLRLIEVARSLRHVEPIVLDLAAQLVLQRSAALDAGPGCCLVHGDLHLENVLWDGGRISALLDFEFARRGPADLDLDVLLRFCADPGLHVAADYEHLATRDQYRRVPYWLREAYPELFAHPRLADRLSVYGLAYDVRELLLDPPGAPAHQLPAHHPYNRIRRTVEGRTHLQWMEW